MSEAKLDIIRLFAIERDAEPKPDIACCSECGGRFSVSECPTEQEGDWETGYYSVHVCPKCEDGGCVDDYDMTPDCAEKWNEWKANNLFTGKGVDNPISRAKTTP